jgi:hypothetical protein
MASKESKNERFKRLAEARTERALYSIRLLGNLSNRSIYDFSDAEVRKIFKALETEIELSREKFTRSRSKRRQGFSLK